MIKRIIRRFASLLAVVFITSFGLVAHTSAMPMGGHDTGGMNHTSGSSSINCATLCSSNTFYKDEQVLAVRQDEDDKPVVPYYAALRSTFTSAEDTASKLYSIAVKPPPKVPIYIRLGIFRV